MMMMCNDLMST